MNDIVETVRPNPQQELGKLIAASIGPELRATLQAFIARYYAQVDPEDLQERLPADLYGAALSHWNFARKRELKGAATGDHGKLPVSRSAALRCGAHLTECGN